MPSAEEINHAGWLMRCTFAAYREVAEDAPCPADPRLSDEIKRRLVAAEDAWQKFARLITRGGAVPVVVDVAVRRFGGLVPRLAPLLLVARHIAHA